MCTQFFAAWIKSLMGTTEDEKAAATTGALAALQMLEGAFGECSKGKPFFAGDEPGYMPTWTWRSGVTLVGCAPTRWWPA
jgi:hypothetical protein